ncbi:MAG: hypothetical protein JEZ04_14980 [Spirochaetales bacterium]|nr:hypothetical protein [Spirochaetales bacterium]
MSSKKTNRIILAAVILYALWLVFYMICLYFDFFRLPDNSASFGFMAAALVSTIIISARIEDLQYSPIILILVFAMGGRLTGFIGDFISISGSGKALFLLPFGGFDFFLFNMLMLGLFRYLTSGLSSKKAFHPVVLIPLVLFAAPVLIHLRLDGLNALTVYSFIFTSVAVWTLSTAVAFALNYPGRRRFAIAVAAAVIADMLVYLGLTPLSVHLPPGLNYLLLPCALFYLTSAAADLTKDDVND